MPEMYQDRGYMPPRRGRRSLGWAILVLGVPLAILAALHDPNEYRATLGVNALDCDGPGKTYLLAVPALLIYGAGVAANGLRWRKRFNAIVAVLCLTICVAVVANLGRAVQEDRRQAASCG
jgi:uncharacterized membrane protein